MDKQPKKITSKQKQKNIKESNIYIYIYSTILECWFSFVLLKKTNTQEQAEVFGLNAADPNFVSSTILENSL